MLDHVKYADVCVAKHATTCLLLFTLPDGPRLGQCEEPHPSCRIHEMVGPGQYKGPWDMMSKLLET